MTRIYVLLLVLTFSLLGAAQAQTLPVTHFDQTYTDASTAAAAPGTPPIPIELIGVTDSLSNYVVGQQSIHQIGFQLPENSWFPFGLLKKRQVVITFPPEFDLSTVTSVTYHDTDDDIDEPDITCVYVYSESVVIRFSEENNCPYHPHFVYFSVNSIGSPVIADDFRVVVKVDNFFGQTVAGPNHSEFFSIIPDMPSQLSVTPDEPIFLQAGQTAMFEARVTDQYGNVIADANPFWSLDANMDPVGQLFGPLLLATTIGTGRVTASLGEYSDSSGPVIVTPGDVYGIEITAAPDTVMAGQPLSSDIGVRLIDRFDNTATQFRGDLWFESDDPLAEVYHDETNPYEFTEQDQGAAVFAGDQFIFKTSGPRILTVTDGDNLSATFDKIYITSDGLAGFDVTWPDRVEAGESFTLAISNAIDDFGNPFTGSIGVSGGAVAPDGSMPWTPDVFVYQGAGGTGLLLFAAGDNEIVLHYGDRDYTYIVTVHSGPEATITAEAGETQFVDNNFIGGMTLALFDRFGNPADEFISSDKTVYLMPDTGIFTPASIPAAVFSGGNVNIPYAKYEGPPGPIRLTISTDTSVHDIATEFDFYANGIIAEIDTRTSIPDSVPAGWDFRMIGSTRNPGNIHPETITILYGFIGSDALHGRLQSCRPELFDGERCRFSITDTALLDPGEYQYTFAVGATYLIDGRTFATLSERLVTIKVLPFIDLTVTPLNLPEVLVRGDYDLSSHINIHNENTFPGQVNAVLFATHRVLGTQISLGNAGLSLEEITDTDLMIPTRILADFPLGLYDYSVGVDIRGMYDNESYIRWYHEYPLGRTLDIVNAAAFSVDAASLAPDTVPASIALPFSLMLQVESSHGIKIIGGQSQLIISDGSVSSSARLADDEYVFSAGSHELTTAPLFIPEIWQGHSLTATLHLCGIEADIMPFEIDIPFAADLTIKPPPSLQIVRLDIDAPNPPFVNTGQTFTLVAGLYNGSETDPVDPTGIVASSDGQSSIAAPPDMPLIAPGDTQTVIFTVVAAAQPNPVERFFLAFDGSAIDAVIEIDNDAVAVVQTPARLQLTAAIRDRLAVVPVLDYGEDFAIDGGFENTGQAQAEGGTVVLNHIGPGDFGVSFPVELPFDTLVSWNLTSPAEDVISSFLITWGIAPTDKNSGLPVTELGLPVPVPFIVEASVTKLVIQPDQYDTQPLERNKQSKLFNLTVENVSTDTRNSVALKTIMITVTDRDGKTIGGDFIVSDTGSAFYLDGVPVTTLSFVNDRLAYRFHDILIAPGEMRTLELRLMPKTEALVDYFNMRLDSDAISAEFAAGPRQGEPVTVTGILDRAFEINLPQAIIAAEFGDSFKNYPNPFNPMIGETEFIYNLPTDSDVDISIYTATGEQVRRLHYPAGSIGGSSDQLSHAFWDGRNGEGDVVLNGVYIAFIEVAEGGLTAKLKIAVVK